MPRKILVTNALPYANGDIHLGHLVGYIQADIWVRYQRMRGHTVHYVCADDTHGTPVMLRAEKEGLSPEQLIARVHGEHLRDFTAFGVAFDNYHSTHSAENRFYAEDIYGKLEAGGLIDTRTIEQYYDPVKEMFLPDRFIKGECPKCGAADQYGDNCEACGAAYTPTELKNPYSAVSGATPVLKTSEHYFFRLSDGRAVDFLRDWTRGSNAAGERRLQAEAANKMKEWLGEAGENKLSDWDISRDAPYFGFEIPGAPGKYFYVWLDAPIGYLASFRNLAAKRAAAGETIALEDYTDAARAHAAGTEMVHFIGKDILYFHALFWPAMLKFARTERAASRVGILLPNTGWGRSNRNALVTAATAAGVSIVGEHWYNWGDPSLMEQYRSLRAAGAQAIIFVANEAEGALLVREVAALPPSERLPIVSHWGVTGGAFAELTGPALDQVDFAVIQTFSFIGLDTPAAKRVLAALKTRYGIAGAEQVRAPVGVAHAYDLTHLLARAIARAGSTDRAKVRDAMEKLPAYPGLVRHYERPFTPDRHDALSPEQVFMARYTAQDVLVPLARPARR